MRSCQKTWSALKFLLYSRLGWTFMTDNRQVMPDDHSELEPPLPIPNRTVKRYRADDSADSSVKVGYRQAIILKSPWKIIQGLFLCLRSGKNFLEIHSTICLCFASLFLVIPLFSSILPGNPPISGISVSSLSESVSHDAAIPQNKSPALAWMQPLSRSLHPLLLTIPLPHNALSTSLCYPTDPIPYQICLLAWSHLLTSPHNNFRKIPMCQKVVIWQIGEVSLEMVLRFFWLTSIWSVVMHDDDFDAYGIFW